MPPQADWIALIAGAEFFFNDSQNESMAENLRERVRYLNEKASRRLQVQQGCGCGAWHALPLQAGAPNPGNAASPHPCNPCMHSPGPQSEDVEMLFVVAPSVLLLPP